jgi:hypothetical protein
MKKKITNNLGYGWRNTAEVSAQQTTFSSVMNSIPNHNSPGATVAVMATAFGFRNLYWGVSLLLRSGQRYLRFLPEMRSSLRGPEPLRKCSAC